MGLGKIIGHLCISFGLPCPNKELWRHLASHITCNGEGESWALWESRVLGSRCRVNQRAKPQPPKNGKPFGLDSFPCSGSKLREGAVVFISRGSTNQRLREGCLNNESLILMSYASGFLSPNSVKPVTSRWSRS